MLFVCLQVNLDAKFVLSNLDAVRRNTSLLVKQGLASDRYLPGLQSHACKRAYVCRFGFKTDVLSAGDGEIRTEQTADDSVLVTQIWTEKPSLSFSVVGSTI